MKNSIIIACFTLLLALPVLAQSFPHDIHVIDNEMSCTECHPAVISPRATLPGPAVCLDCHEADEGINFSYGPRPSSHFGDYRHEHEFAAHLSTGECALCHGESEECTLCHYGENVDFLSHDRNHRYTHALDAMKGTESCYSCHGSQDFCNTCHLAEDIEPANHFVSGFKTAGGHTDAAREDIESCIMCHDGHEPPGTCAFCH